ncbi:hypothetical protein CDLVIII_1526 [Clostridium sp. DL-VIII]|nr:hypothetical protein CDLVIII_1526 [Clostridium sp. DL-VIII]OOM78204.1 hypothetical protein CLOBL_24560 [Clostridium sp. BL-8]
MLWVSIFICAILIGCNAFYNTDETPKRYKEGEQKTERK